MEKAHKGERCRAIFLCFAWFSSAFLEGWGVGGHERLRVPHPWLDQEKNHFFCMCLVTFLTDWAYIYASCLKSWLEGGAFCGTGVRGLAQREYIAQPYGVSLAGRWS